MSDTPSEAISSDSPTCRILTISSSLDQAITFVNRVQALDTHTGSEIASEELQSPPGSSSNPSDTSPSAKAHLSKTIPWTISNKYYSADVHFQAHEIKGLAPYHVQSAPAVIFVWARGEPYRQHVLRISGDISGHEPEVSLAVRIPRSSSSELQEEEEEEESEIDEFLSSHGFEFIDAAEDHDVSQTDDEEDHGFFDGIPGLPRVVDSLSTIMWPSMQAQSRTKPKGGVRDRGELLNWAPKDRDHTYSAVEELVSGASGGGRVQKEVEELVRWLEDDSSLRERVKEDPWKTAADSGAVCTSPTVMEDPHSGNGGTTEGGFGFDDDFTVFVSAPAQEPDGSGRSTPNDSFEFGSTDVSFEASFEADRLGATHAGPLYRSLGSVSDLGMGSDDGKDPEHAETKDVDTEDELPSPDEIRATSARIFGPPPPLTRTTTERPLPSHSEAPSSSISDARTPTATSTAFSFDSILPPSAQNPDVDADELYELAPFDLSRVLSALQGMKAEIASMEDEGERRRAAAKVALGLVYGLEAEAGGGEGEDDL